MTCVCTADFLVKSINLTRPTSSAGAQPGHNPSRRGTCPGWPRPRAATDVAYNISLTSVNVIIKYDLQLKCMLVCCGMVVARQCQCYFFYQNSQSIKVPSFLLKHLIQTCSAIISAVSQLLMKYLYSTVNSTVEEQIYMTTELIDTRIIFIHISNGEAWSRKTCEEWDLPGKRRRWQLSTDKNGIGVWRNTFTWTWDESSQVNTCFYIHC